jgi:hypothetical protein
MTIQRPTTNKPNRADKAAQTTMNQFGIVESNILAGILPSPASVDEAITRLQRERDLALRRIDELNTHYKRELQAKDDQRRASDMRSTDFYRRDLQRATDQTAQCQQQIEVAKGLIETQKLSIKLLEEELGEEAEFDQDESPQMRSVRRECDRRVEEQQERIYQLQSDLDAAIATKDALLEKSIKDLKDARDDADDAQRGAITMFNEQKRHESHIERMTDEVHRAKAAA